MKSKTSILILEDNLQQLSFYKNIFSVSRDWDLVFCKSFDKALGMLKHRNFDYVISEGILEDSSMTGIEFLKEVSNLHPETIRLYVSSKTPFNEDYYYFHAFITKSELSCNTLLEVMNCMSEDTSSIIYS